MKPPRTASVLAWRHLRFGWFALAGFALLGLVLEGMHGLKVGWYLDVSNETRRLMFTLAHAHGALLALVNLAFASAVRRCGGWSPRTRQLASHCLLGASVLMPAGFFVGGLVVYSGDPGLGIFLVPPAALLLLVALVLTAIATLRAARPQGGPDAETPRDPSPSPPTSAPEDE